MKPSDDPTRDPFELENADSSSVETFSALARALPPRAPSAARRARLLAEVGTPALRWAPLFGKLGALFDLPDAALTELAERAALEREWQVVPLPGVKLLHL
jgi:hypothetical protein